MLPEKQNATNLGVGVGIVLEIIGGVLRTQGESMAVIGLLVTIVGAAVFIWGCINYAQGKGYSGALGLLGLLSCIGLLILVVLPDKYPRK
jgi:hypothetical protein